MRPYLIIPLVSASLLLPAPQLKSFDSGSPALKLSTHDNVARQQLTSLCRKSEQVLFTCRTAGPKIISLCGSKQLTSKSGYLQYRFGKPGAIELQFPQSLENTQSAFRYDHYFRYQVDRTHLNFENGGYKYSLFDYYEGDIRPKIMSAGVDVTAPGNEKGTQINCRGRAVSRLGTLESVVPTMEDSELNPD